MKTRFGPWLRQELARRDMRQADLARKMKTSTGAVSDWVNGKTIPSPASIDLIADVLLVNVDELLTLAGHRPAIAQDELDRFHAKIDPYILKLDERGRETVLDLAAMLARAVDTRQSRTRGATPGSHRQSSGHRR